MKRLKAVVAVAAVLLTATACSSGGTGFPIVTTDDISVSSGSGASGSLSTPPPDGRITDATELAGTQACSLLTAVEAAGLGLPNAGTPNDAGAKSGCEWDGSNFIVTALIRTNVGLAGVVPNGTLTSTSIGSHQAKKLVNGTGVGASCMYIVGVTDSTRVDVQAVAAATSDPCRESLSVAQLIEPKLP